MPKNQKRRNRKHNPEKAKTPKSPWIGVLIGVLVSIPASIALVALAAFLLVKNILPFESIPVINPVVKAVCAVAAGFIGARRAANKKALFGAAAGTAYIVAATLAFALFGGGLTIGAGTLTDIAMCAAAGAIGGSAGGLFRG